MNSQTWKRVSSKPTEGRGRREALCPTGHSLQWTTCHENDLQQTKPLVLSFSRGVVHSSCRFFVYFLKDQAGSSVENVESGRQHNYSFITSSERARTPVGPSLSSSAHPSRKQAGHAEHTYPTPNVWYHQWDRVFASQWNSSPYREGVFVGFFPPS